MMIHSGESGTATKAIRLAVISVILAGNLHAQPAPRPPAEPRVRPQIPKFFEHDADHDHLEDALRTRATRATKTADLAKMIEVELVFDQQITQPQIDAFLAEGGIIDHVFESVSYGWTGRVALTKIKTLPGKLGASMVLLEEAKPGQLLLMKATQNGRVRAVWSSTFNTSTGYDGSSNIAIAILDSGVDNTHTDLSGRRAFFADYSTSLTGITSELDYNQHGTHVAGIAVGTGASGGSGTGTLYFSQTGDLSSVSSGSFIGGFVEMPATSLTWASTATWEGGGSTTLKHLYSASGSASYTAFDTSASGTSTRSLSSVFTPSTSRIYTSGMPSIGGETVGDYVVANSITNHAGVGDGFNKFRGVAPGCNWVNARVATDTGATTSSVIATAVDAMVTNRELYNIKVMNLSLESGTSTTLRSKVNTAVDNGIIVVAAIGNSGETSGTVTDPGSAAKAITVGASNAVNALTSYTSLGITSLSTTTGEEQDCKPDILAPGGSDYYGHILSTDSNSGDDQDPTGIPDQRANDYTPLHGTSMAAPFVSGVAALVVDAMQTSGYTWDFTSDTGPKLVKMLINATATETNANREISGNNPTLQRASTGPNSFPSGKDRFEGYGMINADAAVEAYVKSMTNSASVAETFDGTAIGRRAFARKVTIYGGQPLSISLAVPSTGDNDLYLYSYTPGNYGKPTILASSVNAANDTDEAVSYTSNVDMTAFLVVKRVSGSGLTTVTTSTSNDNFANAFTFYNATQGDNLSFTGTGYITNTNSGYTTEASEPTEITSNSGHSAWFNWTSPVTGSVTFTASGGQKVQIYTGSSVSALATIGSSTNSATQTFTPTAGTLYRIALFGSTNAAYTITWTVNSATALKLTNSTIITHNSAGLGKSSPSPSQITISGISNNITSTAVTLNSITHTWLEDLDIGLVDPNAAHMVHLVSDTGDNSSVTDLTVTITDSALEDFPVGVPISGNSYRPTDLFPTGESTPGGGTSGTYNTSFSGLIGTSPLGSWSLYVNDDAFTGTYGDINGGWTLSLTLNQPPVIAGNTASASYIEDAAATLLQPAATVTDSDSNDFNTGSLSVELAANSDPYDTISISSQGTGAGQIGVSGSNVTYGGTTIATYTGGAYLSGSQVPLLVTFNSSSSVAAAQALLRRITFYNSSQLPATIARTVKFTLADGDGSSAAFTQTVNVTAVNDTPTLTSISALAGATEDTAFTLSYTTLAAAANENDADETVLSFRIETVSSGTLTKSGIAVTAGTTLLSTGESLVWTPALNANGTVAAFTVKVTDGTAASATAVTVNVSVTAVNDAPTLTFISTLGGAIEDSTFTISYTTLAAAANEADVDGTTPSFRIEAVNSGTLTKSGVAVTAGTTTLSSGESVIWTPAPNANGSLSAFTLKAYDGTLASSAAVQVTVTVSAINDAPTLTSISTLSGATEDTAFTIAYTTLAAAANEADPEGDVISFRIDAVSSGTLTKSGVAVSPSTTLISLGESVVWTPAVNANGTLAAFAVRAYDGLATSSAVTVNVTTTAVNDAPTLTSISTISGAAEDTAFSISYTTLATAANEADAENDPISFRIETVSTGTLTKSGVAVAAGTTLLATGESLVWTPALNANGTLAAFTIKAYDGTAFSTTAVQVDVDVAAVHDIPIWDGGALTSAWGTATNWSGDEIPISGDAVTFSGATPLTVDLGADRSIGSLAFSGTSGYILQGNTLTLAGGALSIASGAVTHIISSALSLPTSLTSTVGAGSTLHLSGAVAGTSLTTAGVGKILFSNTAIFSGGVTIGAGTLQIGNGGTTGGLTGNIVNNGSLVFNKSLLYDYLGDISGTGTVTQSGTTTVRLPGNNTFTGPLYINSAVVAIGNGGSTGSITANIVDNTTLIFNRNTDYTYNGTITGTGSLYKVNGNTLTLTGTNTYPGTTHIEGGILVFSQSSNIGTGTIRIAGGTLRWATGNTTDVSSRTVWFDGGGGSLDTNGNNVTLASAIGNNGSGKLTKTGNGTLTLLGANTYTGGTTVSQGVLQIGNGGTSGSLSGPVTLSGSSVLAFNRSSSLTITAEISRAVSSTPSLKHLGTGDLILDNVTAAESVYVTGGGTLRSYGLLTAQNCYIGNSDGGGTLISDGFVQVTTNFLSVGQGSVSLVKITDDAILSTQSVTIGSLGYVAIRGDAKWINNGPLIGGATAIIIDSGSTLETKSLDAGITLNRGSLTFTADANPSSDITVTNQGANLSTAYSVTLTGDIAIDGLLTKSGSGTVTLGGSTSGSGSLEIGGGAIATNSAVLSDTLLIKLTTGATLNLDFTGTDTIAQLYLGGVLQTYGTWGGLTSTATHKTALITGAGILIVTNGITPTFATWALDMGLDGTAGKEAGFTDDPEHDGISNGLEYTLGGNPLVSDPSILPQPVIVGGNLQLTFTRNDESESAVSIAVQSGSDLNSWTTDVISSTSNGPNASGVTITVSENGISPDSIAIEIPVVTNGPRFLRLVATE